MSDREAPTSTNDVSMFNLTFKKHFEIDHPSRLIGDHR